ncbi:hypothetical protein H9638_06695 [Arthrobacter sp. Sa2BUA2]|uniref:Uncharacterized protein n=1 Tax=Arthrobacter pullicola TaxID=2762224 RepID=A0ABR8YH90_9MICC|nr:hypothetical protein [Arthrobacter pullicola]MBD8043497.1 hypothetical protein [Arthrobacter pullicola]
MDQKAAGRLAARYARRAEPIGLTPEELDFDHTPVTTSLPAIPVWAWIRFPGCAELVKGETCTWSAKAVQVLWEDAGIRRSTWVWASAVSRRSAEGGRSSLGDRTPARKSKN